jgi:Zn-dependent peptidase ImmA (M78 family)/DNA-binding XRE family transcriptional regulator
MIISGERVRQAREIRAMTQKRLADLVEVSQAAIAQIEAGAFVASDDLVDAIARTTKQPITFFTQPPAPEFSMGSLLFRSHASMTKREMTSVCRYAEWVYEALERLRKRTRSLPVKISPLMGMDPQKAALKMRSEFQIPRSLPVPHLLNVLEWSGVLVISIPKEKTRDAFSFWHNGIPILAVSRESPGDRGRISVAHELGHLVLHAGKSRLEVDDGEGDEFAAEFLMPEQAMRDEIKPPVTLSSLAALKPKWRVSIQALIRRAKDLSIITVRQYRYLFEQLSAMGWRLKEPIEIEPEKPRALRQMAEIVYGNPIDIERMAAEVNARSEDLRELLSGYEAKRTDSPRLEGKVVTLRKHRA